LIGGDKQLVFLAVLAARLIFKTAWWYVCGSKRRHAPGSRRRRPGEPSVMSGPVPG
jgi:hypothetical protein